MYRAILALNILLFSVNFAKGETYFFNAPQNDYAHELAQALENALPNDVFILNTPNGLYNFETTVEINSDIIIKSADNITQPILAVLNGESIFQVSSSIKLTIINLKLEESSYSCINFLATNNELVEYELIARHCIFISNNAASVKAEAQTWGNKILFENCFFHNSVVLEFNNDLVGDNASFNNLEMQSCAFLNCSNGVLLLPEAGGNTYGNVLINHCAFDSVSRNDSSYILDLQTLENVEVKNTIFSNSTNPDPFRLHANALLDYCNFYRCNDLGNQTGSHCYYYNPIYDEGYFVTNEALFGKADDGRNMGILPWIYNGEDEDTIDIGDNPHGFDNQGVWVVPIQGEDQRWESYFLKYNEYGKLWYRKQKQGDKIPDFSYVGYKMGAVVLPEPEVVATINPIDGDATSYFQQVIDSVAQHVPLNADGFRGAILVKAGNYELNSAIFLNSDGIVLKGEGDNDEGTVLTATSTITKSKLINIGNASGTLTKYEASEQDIAASYIPVGSNFVIINSDNDYNVNDHVCLYQQMNAQWVSAIKMDQIPDDGDVVQWNPSDYKFTFERKVKRIGYGTSHDTIYFYNPVVMALDAQYCDERKLYKCSFSSRVNNCGVENMLLKSVYASDEDENHAWDALYFDRAENCWAKNITSKYFAYACANVSSYARYITVTHCTSLSPKSVVTGSRRYSFNCNGQTNLFSYCKASEGRHDFVTGARVCGPNVFTSCSSVNASNDIGPHHRWSMGTLFDNVVTEGEINVRDRASMGTGHGWAGANQVLWNCKGASAIVQNPWASAANYNIGFTGQFVDYTTYGNKPRGEWDGCNVKGLKPASLYYAQRVNNNLNIDFGLENTQGYFINDSTFQLNFNQAFEVASALNISHYDASGTAGISGIPQSVSQIDSITVQLHFNGFGILAYNKTVILSISDVMSKSGNPISGISKAQLVVPDLRPKIDIHYQTITNAIGVNAELTSSKSGWVYIIHSDNNPQSTDELNTFVSEGIGNKTVAIADSLALIPTHQLAAGTYYAYAIDTDGRMSSKGEYGVVISDVLTVNNTKTEPFQIYNSSEGLYITILEPSTMQNHVWIYDVMGRLFCQKRIEEPQTFIALGNESSWIIVCMQVNNEIYTKKLINIF